MRSSNTASDSADAGAGFSLARRLLTGVLARFHLADVFRPLLPLAIAHDYPQPLLSISNGERGASSPADATRPGADARRRFVSGALRVVLHVRQAATMLPPA
jgi:hypothetical protein